MKNMQKKKISRSYHLLICMTVLTAGRTSQTRFPTLLWHNVTMTSVAAVTRRHFPDSTFVMHLSMSSPRRGVGGRATHGNLTVTHIPKVGILTWHHAFDLSISKSRWEVNNLFLLILTIIFCPGVGILILFFRKCQNPDRMLPPLPPLGLTLIGALADGNFQIFSFSAYFSSSFLPLILRPST